MSLKGIEGGALVLTLDQDGQCRSWFGGRALAQQLVDVPPIPPCGIA